MSEEIENDLYQIVRGLPCPTPRMFDKKNIEDAMDYVPEEGDLIMATYPKTGTTWMQYILLQIKSRGESFPSFHEVMFKVFPYIEASGLEPLLAQDKPRNYKHHLPYNFVQKNGKSKVVYAYRNPEDTVVSFYHFSRDITPGFNLNFDEFFDNFVTGKVAYGNYFQHVLSFYKHRCDDNLLMVSYEKLHANRKEEILRIAKFLGEEHNQSLLEDPKLLEKIIERTTFDYMKKNLPMARPNTVSDVQGIQPEGEAPKVNFFRKGIVGDGKTALTVEQRRILREAAEKVLKGTTVLDEWYPS